MEQIPLKTDKIEDVSTMTISGLMTTMSIGRNTALRLIHSEGFPWIRIGKKYVIPVEAFKQWLNTHIGEVIC